MKKISLGYRNFNSDTRERGRERRILSRVGKQSRFQRGVRNRGFLKNIVQFIASQRRATMFIVTSLVLIGFIGGVALAQEEKIEIPEIEEPEVEIPE